MKKRVQGTFDVRREKLVKSSGSKLGAARFSKEKREELARAESVFKKSRRRCRRVKGGRGDAQFRIKNKKEESGGLEWKKKKNLRCIKKGRMMEKDS